MNLSMNMWFNAKIVQYHNVILFGMIRISFVEVSCQRQLTCSNLKILQILNRSNEIESNYKNFMNIHEYYVCTCTNGQTHQRRISGSLLGSAYGVTLGHKESPTCKLRPENWDL